MIDPQQTFHQIRNLRLTQDDLAAATFRATSKGVTIVANGNLEILEVKLPGKMKKDELEKAIKNAMNSLVKKVHANHMKQMQSLIK